MGWLSSGLSRGAGVLFPAVQGFRDSWLRPRGRETAEERAGKSPGRSAKKSTLQILPETIYSVPMKRLFAEGEVRRRVNRMAREISRDFAGREVLLVGVLKGAFIFLSDLSRRLAFPVKVDFIRLASYGGGTESSGKVRITKDLEISPRGRDVLVVDDIVDTGVTLEYLFRRLKARRPRSLKSVVLLDKPSRRKVPFRPDYAGFTIPDRFVVGYGLDFKEEYRNLRGIYVLE